MAVVAHKQFVEPADVRHALAFKPPAVPLSTLSRSQRIRMNAYFRRNATILAAERRALEERVKPILLENISEAWRKLDNTFRHMGAYQKIEEDVARLITASSNKKASQRINVARFRRAVRQQDGTDKFLTGLVGALRERSGSVMEDAVQDTLRTYRTLIAEISGRFIRAMITDGVKGYIHTPKGIDLKALFYLPRYVDKANSSSFTHSDEILTEIVFGQVPSDLDRIVMDRDNFITSVQFSKGEFDAFKRDLKEGIYGDKFGAEGARASAQRMVKKNRDKFKARGYTTKQTRSRTELWARTEGVVLGNDSLLKMGDELGMDGKVWDTVEDSLVRDAHTLNQSAGVIPMHHKFPDGSINGGSGSVSPYNCRCAVGPAMLPEGSGTLGAGDEFNPRTIDADLLNPDAPPTKIKKPSKKKKPKLPIKKKKPVSSKKKPLTKKKPKKKKKPSGQLPAEGLTPYEKDKATGTGADKTEPGSLPGGRQFYVDSKLRGGEYFEGIKRTKEDHKFGASVDLKDRKFYLNPKNKLFMSDDGLAGVVVSADGDLVSGFRHPTSKADMGALFNESAKHGTHSDFYDVKGKIGLPDIYAAHGMRPLGRIKWDDKYAPPDWDYELGGRPDLVLGIRDVDGRTGLPLVPSVADGGYASIREDVPLFDDYNDAVKARKKLLDKATKPLEITPVDLKIEPTKESIVKPPEPAPKLKVEKKPPKLELKPPPVEEEVKPVDFDTSAVEAEALDVQAELVAPVVATSLPGGDPSIIQVQSFHPVVFEEGVADGSIVLDPAFEFSADSSSSFQSQYVTWLENGKPIIPSGFPDSIPFVESGTYNSSDFTSAKLGPKWAEIAQLNTDEFTSLVNDGTIKLNGSFVYKPDINEAPKTQYLRWLDDNGFGPGALGPPKSNVTPLGLPIQQKPVIDSVEVPVTLGLQEPREQIQFPFAIELDEAQQRLLDEDLAYLQNAIRDSPLSKPTNASSMEAFDDRLGSFFRRKRDESGDAFTHLTDFEPEEGDLDIFTMEQLQNVAANPIVTPEDFARWKSRYGTNLEQDIKRFRVKRIMDRMGLDTEEGLDLIGSRTNIVEADPDKFDEAVGRIDRIMRNASTVDDLITNWATSSNDRNAAALHMQEVVDELFGIKNTPWQEKRMQETVDFIRRGGVQREREIWGSTLRQELRRLRKESSELGGVFMSEADIEEKGKRFVEGKLGLFPDLPPDGLPWDIDDLVTLQSEGRAGSAHPFAESTQFLHDVLGEPFREEMKGAFDPQVEDLVQGMIDRDIKTEAIIKKGATQAAKKFIRSMYEETQADLNKAGVERVTLYRGAVIHKSQVADMLTRGTGEEFEASAFDRVALEHYITKYQGNAIESWTPNESEAMKFASGGVFNLAKVTKEYPNASAEDFISVIYEASVPAERILSSARTGYGAMSESEFVVLGAEGDQIKMVLLQEFGG